MSGVTMSFHADQAVSQRLSEIAAEDGVTVSRLVRQLLVPGLVLPAVGRRMLRRVLSEGGPEAVQELREQMTHALALASNRVMERRVLAEAARRNPNGPKMTEEEIDRAAVGAIEEYRREVVAPRGPGL